jgi:hypothetical protein
MIYATAFRLIGRQAWAAPATGDDPLRDMAADTAARYPLIAHQPPAVLAETLRSFPDQTLLSPKSTAQGRFVGVP